MTGSGIEGGPTPYTVDESQAIIRITLSGTLTNPELVALARDLVRIESAAGVVPNRLTDVRPVTHLEIDFRGVLAYSTQRLRARFPNSFKSAVVANDVVHYGFARMFETLNDHPQIVIAIFSDEREALRWLGEPGVEPYVKPGASRAKAD